MPVAMKLRNRIVNYHPDINPDDKTAEENFKAVQRHMKHYQTLIRKVSMIKV
jgi:DnaJ-class molecular chaperone